MSAQTGILAAGRLHSAGRCHICGARGGLRETVVRETYARALVCTDTVECERRRYLQKLERAA